MFAIFLSDKMDPFYQNVSSFPTVIFTFFLLLCFFYWIIAVLGLVDLDFLDFDIPDAEVDINVEGGMDNINVLAGLLMRMGLTGVPFPIVISIISLLGWFVSYYAVYFIFDYIPGSLLKYLVGIPVFVGSLYLAALATAYIIKPLRAIFAATNQQVQKKIVGQIAIVRTTKVNSNFGEATVEDGGAGLIIKVRSYKDEEFARGDKVVLLEYIKEENIYKVISEADFNHG